MKSTKNSGFDVTVGPCRFFLRLFGVWPDPFTDSDWFCYVRATIVISTMVFFATITQTVKNIQVWGDLNVVTEIFINSEVPTSTAALKVAGVWYYRRALQNLTVQILEDWQTSHDSKELRIMNSNAKFGRYVSITCIFLANATFIVQGIIAFWTIGTYAMSLNFQNDSTVTQWPLYMKGSFPYNTEVSPNYELTLIGQLFSNFFAASTYTSIDSLFIVLMLHLCGQLSVLRLTMIEFGAKANDVQARGEFEKKIAFIHRRHNQLIRFGNTIEEVFNKTFLVQMLTSSFVLCMQGYQLLTITSGNNLPFMQLIFMIYYLQCFLFITFTYCYMSEQLFEKSTELANAAYESNWIDLPSHQSRQMIIIMMRARRPLKITAGKFVSFSLALYCSILKSSGGYMSMLLAIQKRVND